jgi:hypothetical protein
VQFDRTGMTYYRNDACTAKDAHAPDCICWTPAQPAPVQEPALEVTKVAGGIEWRWLKGLNANNFKVGDKLYTTPPAAPAQEPVAWMLPGTDSFLTAASKTHHGVRAESYTTPLYTTPPEAQPAPVQEPLTVKLKDDWRTDDWGKPIIYDTDEVDEVTGALTGDEGEEDSLTVLNSMVRYVSNVWPGKTALQVLIECEEAMIATPPAAKQEPVAWVTGAWVTGFYAGRCDIKTINPAAILPVGVALYTTPPAAQPAVPLTDAQRRAIIAKLSEADYADGDEWDNALFDAIEAAHGITSQASEKGQP